MWVRAASAGKHSPKAYDRPPGSVARSSYRNEGAASSERFRGCAGRVLVSIGEVWTEKRRPWMEKLANRSMEGPRNEEEMRGCLCSEQGRVELSGSDAGRV